MELSDEYGADEPLRKCLACSGTGQRINMKKEKVDCWQCRGTGKISDRICKHCDGMHYTDYGDVCPSCTATGKPKGKQ